MSGVDDGDGTHALKSQLVDEKHDKKATAKHIEQLRGKLQHIIDRIDSPPGRIFAHLKIYAEIRPELFDDSQCTHLLKGLLRACKTVVRKTSMAQSNDASSPIAVFAAKSLYSVYREILEWPLDLLELYMDDALGQRQWVDSPLTSTFTKSLLHWTVSKEITAAKPDVSSSPPKDKNATKKAQNAFEEGEVNSDDESSGDEEVLEESSGASAGCTAGYQAPSKPIITMQPPAKDEGASDRFIGNRQAAKAIVIDLLTLKSGYAAGKQQGQGTTSTSTIVITMSSFCGLPEIRQLASYCLDRWLGNPAIVDHVKSLLRRMAECLEVITSSSHFEDFNDPTSNSGSSRSSRQGGETLAESDMNVVKEIVKLRFRLKASQLELYKSTLILIANKGLPVTKLIMRCMIAADLNSGSSSVRSETVKLLLAILNARYALFVVGIKDPGSNLKSGVQAAVYQSGISRMMGEVFGGLCSSVLTNTSPEDEVRDRERDRERDTGDEKKDREALCVSPTTWTPVYSRMLLDLLVRILRSLDGACDLDYAALLEGVLGSPTSLCASYFAYRDGVDKDREMGNEENKSNMKGSKPFVLDWELTIFYADVCIALQLTIASEITAADRLWKEKVLQLASSNAPAPSSSSAGGAFASSSPGGYGSSAAVGREVHSTVQSGVGGVVSGRGIASARGRGGRGSSAASAHSSMFRGSAMRASAAGTMGGRGKPPLASAVSNTAAPAPLVSANVSKEQNTMSCEELDLKFHADRDLLLPKMLAVQECVCVWVTSLCTSLHSGLKDRKILNDPSIDFDLFQSGLEWIQKVCCLNQFGVSKIQSDFDKNAGPYVRENGVVSTVLLDAVVSFIMGLSRTNAHISCGLGLLEVLVHRGVKSAGPGRSGGILVTDTEIIPRLFELSEVTLYSQGGRFRSLLRPALALKGVYWRVSALCFTLGCARPESLGLFLWTQYPSVRSLMLMAISSRFAVLDDVASDDCVGTKQSDAALMATHLEIGGRDSSVFKYVDYAGVELFISRSRVEPRYGRVQDAEKAVTHFERALFQYLFGDVPSPTVAHTAVTAPSSSNSSSGNGISGERKRMRSAIEVEVESKQLRDRQGQRREQERGARAERAAARMHRETVPVFEEDITPPPPVVAVAAAPANTYVDKAADSSALDGLLLLAGASSTAKQSKIVTGTGTDVEIIDPPPMDPGPSIDLDSMDVTSGDVDDSIVVADESGAVVAHGTDTVSSQDLTGGIITSTPVSVTAFDSIEHIQSSTPVPLPVPVEVLDMRVYIIPTLTSKCPKAFTTSRGSVEISDLIILRCQGVPRTPPDDVINSAKMLSLKFGFDAKLRSCTDPDFITRAISGDEEISTSHSATGKTAKSSGKDGITGQILPVSPRSLRLRNGCTVGGAAVPLFRVSRPAVEASSSWLVPAICEDADAILQRIPVVACLHLLLLSTLKTFCRLNMYGIWGDESPYTHIPPLDTTTPHTEVSRASIPYFESTESLVQSLFRGKDHAVEIHFLSVLAAKVRLMYSPIPSSSSAPTSSSSSSSSSSKQVVSAVQKKEQRSLLKILLGDLKSNESDRRAASRLVLSFLAPSTCATSKSRYGEKDRGREDSKSMKMDVVLGLGLSRVEEEEEDEYDDDDVIILDGSDPLPLISVTDADITLESRSEIEIEKEKEKVSVSEQERNREMGEEILRTEEPSSIAQSIRSAFKAGPWRVDFSAFLLATCAPQEQEQQQEQAKECGVSADAAIRIEEDVTADRSMVLHAVRAAAMQESDVHVILQLLQTAHTFRVPPTQSNIAVEPAADILCALFTSRRLTADYVVQYIVQSNRLDVLSDMLMTALNQIQTFTQTSMSIEDDTTTVAEPVVGEVMLTKSMDGQDVTLSKNTETLRLLVFIAGMIVRCDGANSDDGVGIKTKMMTEMSISTRSSSESLFMSCASAIVSCCTVKDCRKHFLPLLADALCNTPYPSPPRDPHTLLPHPSVTPAYHSLLGSMPPLGLLDLLAIAGVTGATAAGGVTTLTSSGLTVDCLQFIVNTIDKGVRSTMCGDSSTGECWQVLVKPFSAKRIERIQCELQPLILWVIATTIAGAKRVRECVEGEKEEVTKSKEEMDLEMSVIAVENLRSWALQSITLSNLFTLKELHTNNDNETDAHTGADLDAFVVANAMVCTSNSDDVLDLTKEHKMEVEVVKELEEEKGSRGRSDILDIPSPVLLPQDKTVSESASTSSCISDVLGNIRHKDSLSALQLCVEFLRIVPLDQGSRDDVIQMGTTVPPLLPDPLSLPPPPSHLMEVEQSEESMSSTGDERVLSWCRDLLRGAAELPSRDTHAAALVVSTALLSCDKENVLFSLAFCIDADSHCRAHNNKVEQSKGGQRWHISAILLSSLLTECWELSLSRFKRGIDIMESLPPLQTDGSAMYVLVRQLLMLVAEGMFDCSRGLVVANLHITDGQDVQSGSPKIQALKSFTASVLSAVSDFTAMLVHHSDKSTSAMNGSHFRNTIRLTASKNRMSSRTNSSSGGSSYHQQVMGDKEELRRECESILKRILQSDESLLQSWSHVSFNPNSRNPI